MTVFSQLDRERKRYRRLYRRFRPEFSWVDNVEVVAEMINAPHIDDYDQIVQRTQRTKIILTTFFDKFFPTYNNLTTIHYLLWGGLNPKKIRVGAYRRSNVYLGATMMPRWEFVSQLMDEIRTDDPIEWYRSFESVHPFEDGNGRVGGIVVALLSRKNGNWLAPHQ